MNKFFKTPELETLQKWSKTSYHFLVITAVALAVGMLLNVFGLTEPMIVTIMVLVFYLGLVFRQLSRLNNLHKEISVTCRHLVVSAILIMVGGLSLGLKLSEWHYWLSAITWPLLIGGAILFIVFLIGLIDYFHQEVENRYSQH